MRDEEISVFQLYISKLYYEQIGWDLKVGFNPTLKGVLRTSSDEAVNFFTVFLDDVGRDAQNPGPPGPVAVFVHVDLFKLDLPDQILFQFPEDRCHHLARSTPISVIVDELNHGFR